MGNLADAFIKNVEIPAKIVDGINKNSNDLIHAGSSAISTMSNNAKEVTINAEKVVSKTFTDVTSTAQYGIFIIGLPLLVFFMNTSGDKVADTVIKPAEAVIDITKKIP